MKRNSLEVPILFRLVSIDYCLAFFHARPDNLEGIR
jgi:hypothetical protein